MKKILGLSTLALASVLAFTGCSSNEEEKSATNWIVGDKAPTTEGKDGDFYFDNSSEKVYYKQNGVWEAKQGLKDVEKFERINIGETSDTYKITYTDGSSDTFDVKKGDVVTAITKAELEEAYLKAMSNSKKEEEITIIETNDGDSGKIVFYGDQIYVKDSDYYRYEVLDSNNDNLIEYMYNEKNNSRSSSKTSFNFPTFKEYYFESYYSATETLDQMITMGKNRTIAVINYKRGIEITADDIELEINYSFTNGKYIATITAKYVDEDVEDSLVFAVEFGDRIEKLSQVSNFYNVTEDKKEIHEATFNYIYEADSSLKKTDFSAFPELEQSSLATKLTFAQLEEKLLNGDEFVLLLDSDLCSHCETLYTTINRYVNSGKKVYSINLANLNENQLEMIENKLVDEIAIDRGITSLMTPTTIYVNEGEFKDAVAGAYGMIDMVEYEIFVDIIEGEYVGKPVYSFE